MAKTKHSTLAVALSIEWLHSLLGVDRLGRVEVDLNSIKSPNIREALNQVRKGVSNYKRIMKAEKSLVDDDFEGIRVFAAYKMETLTILAGAFAEIDEEGCMFLTNELLKAVEKLRKKKEKERLKQTKSITTKL